MRLVDYYTTNREVSLVIADPVLVLAFTFSLHLMHQMKLYKIYEIRRKHINPPTHIRIAKPSQYIIQVLPVDSS